MSSPPEFTSIISPSPSGASTCGYCGPPGQRSSAATSYHSANFHAYFLSCSVYQDMIDRGWRRSGRYCYKPDLRISCCPQYTIRLGTAEYKPSRSQRKLLNRWNRYVFSGGSDSMDVIQSSSTKPPPKSHKTSLTTVLTVAIHESEIGFHNLEQSTHNFQVTLEPSSFTMEKFELFKKYQTDIHQDIKNTPSGFKRFLVDSPLNPEPIPYASEPANHLPKNYGSYHQLYRLDGQLIAMGVLDILPSCVSSVYFMYDKTWQKYSMGKISALREASLAREMQEAGAPGMAYLYMGFYIHSCQKMKYKGDYEPSFLLDPETYEWYPIEICKSLLEKHRYACFSDPSHSSNDNEDLEMLVMTLRLPAPSADSPILNDVKLIARTEDGHLITVPIKETGYLSVKQVREELGHCVRGLGTQLTSKVVFNVTTY